MLISCLFICFKLSIMVKKRVIQDSYDLTNFILLARYHSKAPTDQRLAYCSYATISRLVNRSVETVRQVCVRYFKQRAELSKHVIMRSKRMNKVGLRLSKCYGRLTDRQVEDLCSQSNLKASAGLSLSARA